MPNDVFQIKPACRENTPALIALWGESTSGKTYGAILLARGLVGPKGKIVLIDTENRRSKVYSDLAGGWDHMDFQPPFSPERYIQAMSTAEKAGAKVIIIDSASHVWEGQGGVLSMAEAVNQQGLLKWQKPKLAYKRMLNYLLRAPTHVIFCLRAKDKIVQMKNAKNETELIHMGPTPIAEKNFIYEMTIAMRLGKDHLPTDIKCPPQMAGLIKPDAMISLDTGRAIADWLAGGTPVDQGALDILRQAKDVAAEGTAAFRKYWKTLKADQRNLVKTIMPEIESICFEADENKKQLAQATAEETGAAAPQTPVGNLV